LGRARAGQCGEIADQKQHPPETRNGESGAHETVELDALAGLSASVPADIREVAFPVSLRGYDREAVGAHVRRVNHLIAELEVSRSPQSAVKHALDRVGEQAASVLEHARQAAGELTSAASAKAEHARRRAGVEAAESLEKAEGEACDLVEAAKREADQILARARSQAAKQKRFAEEQATRLHERAAARLLTMKGEIEQTSEHRSKLIEDLRTNATELHELANRMLAEEHSWPIRGEQDRPRQADDDAGKTTASPAPVPATAADPDEPEQQPTKPLRSAGWPRAPRPAAPAAPAETGRPDGAPEVRRGRKGAAQRSTASGGA
jgi:DivIVA domain-containing protein